MAQFINSVFVCGGLILVMIVQSYDLFEPCPPGRFFHCDGGECLEMESVCDGFADCESIYYTYDYPADEDETMCNLRTCQPYEHDCGGGHCIPKYYVCDGYKDCGNDENQDMCTNRTLQTGEFDCGQGHYIPVDMLCDGRSDCRSSYDEGEEMCVKCVGADTKIPKSKICDGSPDCPRGEDESMNICSGNFHCNTELTSDVYVVVLNVSVTFDGDLRRCLVWCWETEFCAFVKSTNSICIILSTRAYYNTSYSHFQRTDLGNESSVLRMRNFCQLGCADGDCYHLEDQLVKGKCNQGILSNRMNLDQVNRLQISRLLADKAVVIGTNESNNAPFRITLEEGFQEPKFQIKYESISSTDTEPDVYLCKQERSVCCDVDIHIPNQHSLVLKAAFQCGDGEIVNALARCDGKFDCLNHADEILCLRNDNGQYIHNFHCKNGESVPYSVYCDFVQDCKDGSDEDCVFPECNTDEVRCDNEQCVEYTALCNGQIECLDGSDENQRFCALVPMWWQSDSRRSTMTSLRCKNKTEATCDFVTCGCGQSKCPGSHCIDNTKLCNGELDCPHGEDERACTLNEISRETAKFRCQNNLGSVCLSNGVVCDGKVDCLLAEDERLCTVDTCPAPCTCNIYEVRCNNLDENNTKADITRNMPLNIRYLNISGGRAINFLLDLLEFDLLYLGHLQVSHCNIKVFTNISFAKIPNLIELDLSQNGMTEFKSVQGLSRVRKVDLSQNHIINVSLGEFVGYSELRYLVISHNVIRYIHQPTNGDFKMLRTLDMGYNTISTLSDWNNVQFHQMKNLRILLLNNNKINDTGRHVFAGMKIMNLLNLSHNEISSIQADAFAGIGTLKVLDLSFNKITRIHNEMFRGIETIHDIDLSKNEIVSVNRTAFTREQDFQGKFILNNNRIEELLTDMFGLRDNLTQLHLANNKIISVEDRAFKRLYKLKTLDISSNNIQIFSEYIFVGPVELESLKTDNYKFCCLKPTALSFDNCAPKADEFSSCESLLRNIFASHMMCVIAVFAVAGNLATFLYRTIYDQQETKQCFGLFVTNLSVSDFFMGIYLIIITSADLYYQGSYTLNAHEWRDSAPCKVAGVLSTISSEASVFFLCLITLDRVFVIKWPLGKISFSTKSAVLVSAFSWLLAIFIATLPVLYTDYFGDEFYSVNGVCIALPLTRARPRGWEYSLAVFVFFNFLTFILIALGQILIFLEIERWKKLDTSVSERRKSDLRVARNLLYVVLTDFMCWVPVGVMGIMALAGHTISGDVYVWASVFILPVNAALNPCLYTLSAIIKKEEFVPRQDEQIQVVSITLNMKKWKSFCQRSSLVHINTTQISLTDLLRKRFLEPFEALVIYMELAYQLDRIHKGGLHQGNMNLNIIKLAMQNDKIVKVAVDLLPTSVSKDDDRRGDIYQFGKIGQALINRAKSLAAKPSIITVCRSNN